MATSAFLQSTCLSEHCPFPRWQIFGDAAQYCGRTNSLHQTCSKHGNSKPSHRPVDASVRRTIPVWAAVCSKTEARRTNAVQSASLPDAKEYGRLQFYLAPRPKGEKRGSFRRGATAVLEFGPGACLRASTTAHVPFESKR